jgi:hypothetical protein
MVNLFYDLPGDIRHIIHKKIYTLEVMEELKNRPGNFSFMETTYHFYTGTSWPEQLAMDYRSLEKIGTKAWEYLKTCEDFFSLDLCRPYIYYKIYDTLYRNHVDSVSFRASISNMQMLSRMGWKKYKLIYSLAHQ